MARDYYNESTKSNPWTKKKKDEDKKETGSTKPSQSSSSSNSTSAANNVIERSKNSTFMGGGSSVKSVSSSSSSSSSRPTSTQQSNPPVQTTESRVKSAADKRASVTQKRYSEPIGPSTQRTETRRSLLDRADDFFRTFTEKSNEWEKNNVPARMTPERRTQIDTRNRTAAQNVSQRYQDRMGISDEDKALADYTAGVIKRKALGYAKTASKAVQTNEGKNFSGRWAQEDPEFARHISSHDFAQRADKAFNDYSAEQEKTQKRLTQIENNTSEAGRIALQAYGSGIEMGIDRLAGPLWAASMFASVYGNQRGNALAEGATDEQDARAAFLSAGLEVATEYMFRPAVGIASKFGGPHSLDFAGKLASKVSGKLTGRAAKLADIGIRTLGSMAEENVEELVGWIADPYLQNAAYKNELQKTREEQAHADYEEMQSAFWSQFGTEEEAQEAALHVNSDDFVNDLTETYKASGASDEEARSMAKIMQKYFLAHFDNDEKAAEEAEEAMDAFVVGDVRAHHSWKELAETFASTSLLTGLTGGASAYSTYQMGNQILNSPNGKVKVEDYSNLVQNFDEENTKEAKGIKETIKNGDTPTGTQVYQVASQATEVMSELDQKNTASNQVKDRRMKSEGLTVSPVVMTPQGPRMNEMTEQAYRSSYEKTQGVIRGIRKHGVDAGLDEEVLTDRDTMNTAAHLVAAFETGTITAEEIATELTVDHPEMRTIFEMATGVDLSQYDVQKDGGFYNEVDAVKSNRAMLDGLLAQSSDNYVQMAQTEQKQWENRTRGEVHKAMTNSFGAMGNLAMHPVLKTADTTDQGKYMLTARMAQRVYDYARRTDDEWNDIKHSLKRISRSVDMDAMKLVYDAAKYDKQVSETPYYGRTVESGTAMGFAKGISSEAMERGTFVNESNRELDGDEDEAYTSVAFQTGLNIRLVPAEQLEQVKKDEKGNIVLDEDGNEVKISTNGKYDRKTGTIYLADSNSFGDNINIALSHEMTHHLAVFAPEAYMALSNYVMDRWYKLSPESYSHSIKNIQKLYKSVGQDLSEEEALEEIIADATRDFWNDPEFVEGFTTDNEPSVIKKVINAIKDVISKIRSILSLGNVSDEYEHYLWNILGSYTEAEKLWLNAYKEAQTRASEKAIDEWQDKANRHSVSEGKKSNSAQAKWERDEKLSQSKFNSFYSAHKLNYGRATDETMSDVIDRIKSDGFISTTAISNVVPASINDYVNPEKPNLTQSKYGARAGDTVMFVPNKHVDLKNDIIKNGYKPRDYEIVTVERDYQPYYELYSKAYDESQKTRFSISETDSEGNELSEGQREYFKDSKVVDENGNLLRMYHGTYEDFTVFEPNEFVEEKNGLSRIKGYFSTSEDYSSVYGDTTSYYLNMTNPLYIPDESKGLDEWKEWFADQGVKGVEFDSGIERDDLKGYGFEDGTKGYALWELFDAGDYWYGDGNLTEAIENAGYDGVYWNEGEGWNIGDGRFVEGKPYAYMPFNANAIKSVDNLNPTENEDVRYSVSPETLEELNESGVDITESGTAVKYSLASWTETDQDALLERLVKAGFEKDVAKRWIANVNSVASLIYSDMARLNYEADQYQDALKPNSEYYYTLDLSTLCQKRRLYQGTYNAIMHHLVNKALHPEDTVRLREIMESMNKETPCGICYEESRKKNEGKFAEIWLNGDSDAKWNQKLKAYNKALKEYPQKLADYEALDEKAKKKKRQPKEPQKPVRWMGYANMKHTDPYIPTLDDVTTTDGRARLRKEHPEALEDYLEYQKGRGSANPKVSFTHTDYRGDILRMTKTDIANVKHIGGLRIQSFSDFETVHVIDMMQAIMDMAAMNLTSQAYTKVPAFADIFGGTNVKINLSLIQKMENGEPVYEEYKDEKTGEVKKRLVFDAKEGIDPKEAFRIREKYSKHVGTILVGVSRQQILDAWNDPRVDMVIPFHRSGWSLEEFERLGIKGYEDFQDYQSERYFDPKSKDWISLKDAKMEGIYSADYWDYSKTGKENAKAYLKLCAEKHYRPVFYNFLHDNGDGTWSLPTMEQDGYTADGYWKSLIDFKMYDNEGVGSPQEEVQPIFDMDVAEKVMADYEGNADTLPVAEDVVEAYLKDYKKRHPRAKIDYGKDSRLSIAVDMDDAYMDAVNSGDMDEAQRLVDEAAKSAGYGTKAYHGTHSYGFTKFDLYPPNAHRWGRGLGEGFYFTSNEEVARLRYGYTTTNDPSAGVYNVYLNLGDTLELDWNDVVAKYKKKADFDAFLDREMEDKDSLTVHNIEDGISIPSTVYVIKSNTQEGDPFMARISGDSSRGLYTTNRVKSADTVTYAEDGSIIPLSERFDPNNNDIRYSMPTSDADGNVLTDGQMEFFQNSQARDEKGRLVPVYHVTRTAGFTVFDPTRAFDETSISFTNDLDFALNYSSEDEDLEDWRTAYENRYGMEEVESDLDNEVIGHYKVYLNMTNPLVLEGDYLDEMDIYEWPVYAKANGYDGVIYKDFEEDGSDIYQVFSSNQIKDTRNENPTENPDIRFSIPPEDEAMSYEAHEYIYDDSPEALEYYEAIIEQMSKEDLSDGFINHPMQTYLENMRKYGKADERARKGKSGAVKYRNDRDFTSAFFDGLTWYDTGMKFDDPILEEGRTRMAKSRNDFFNSNRAKWNQMWETNGEVLDVRSIRKPVKQLVMDTMRLAYTNTKYKNDIVNMTLIDMRMAYWYAQRGRMDVADALLWHTANRMITSVKYIEDDTEFKRYKEIRDFIRHTNISMSEEYWADEQFRHFRKKHFGKLNITQGLITNVNTVYQELEERWPDIFNEEQREKVGLVGNIKNFGDNNGDLLTHIGYVVDQNLTPFIEAYSSEEAAALTESIASSLLDIMQENGEALQSKADRYVEQINAMKTRHEEALRKVREQRDKKVNLANEKLKTYKENERAKKTHTKYFKSIQKNYDKLKERLLSNTADKNIPEQYKKELAKVLAAFDLQTVGSKKWEERTGRKSQKSIKMAALKTALNNIEEKTDEFHVSDAITDIMDGLLGKNVGQGPNRSIEGLAIDELTIGELERIDKLLKALVHEFNTYKYIKINAKKQQTADIGKAQVEDALAHAEKYGAKKDFYSYLGLFDNIVNLDEMTAAYMFRKIDPNNTGMGLMFRELRRSFDHYVRNMAQLNQWMDEILEPYQNGGKGLNKYGADQIEQWRSFNYTQTFNLENGTVRLTPAQMMSVYCLAKRTQAYNHMTGAGIVVAPASFDAKMISDVKKKANTALPVKLTDADIKKITTALTPEQIQVAEQLQKLMADKMAAWGNEASMNVLGIELFGEPDYFPIKSDKAGLISDLDENQFVEAIRNFGFTKAVQPGAKNAIMVDDIFKIVAEHCNNMNLYNSYSESINDFMKVFNYRDFREDGSEYTVKQAIAHAYSQKATTFIMRFMKDLNGNVSGSETGISRMYNTLLSNAKKASVFANGRVALQQPTAITRAFAVIDPKYLKGVKIEKGAMKEMFEHCPIALWKSWGYYDIQMGRTIEDIMMNKGSLLEDVETWAYGALDNVTWTAIWQMVKAEMKDTHPDVKEGTDEYWDLCNERMSEIVDLTQVVDSPMHRSHGMRSKNFLEKTATAFMAEPTLTFNMVKDGISRAREAWKSGNKAEAGRIAGRTMSVFLLQAATVSAMAAIWDALRGKNSDDDDDDESKLRLWWINALENFKGELNILNKIYFVKDVSSLFEGYGVNNLALQGWKSIADGWAQFFGTRNVYSSKSWYENLFGGIGSILGVPIGTVLKDAKAIYKLFGLDWKVVNDLGEYLDEMALEPKDEKGSIASSFLSILDGKKNDESQEPEADDGSLMDGIARKLGYKKIGSSADSMTESGDNETETSEMSEDEYRDSLSDNLTEEQKDEIVKAYKRRTKKKAKEGGDADSEESAVRDKKDMLFDAEKAAAGYEGEERNKKIWESVSKGYRDRIAEGDYGSIYKMRSVVEQMGGDLTYFDQQVIKSSKTALKKTIEPGGADTESEMVAQQNIRMFLERNGVSQEDISAIVYESAAAKDLKVAFRINDEKAIIASTNALLRAGLTMTDYERIFTNRNRIDLKKYNGKYKDRLKSTGNFVWPTQGTITSHFGYRDAPTAGASSNHPAIDIGAPQGTAVVAADGGIVISAGANGGYGNSVGIKHDNGMITWYNHLYDWNVREGDTVAQGQQIGQVGSTGISTGPHLDFKIMDTNGNPVDPEKYLS